MLPRPETFEQRSAAPNGCPSPSRGSHLALAFISAATLGCLLLISVAPQGATRIFAWPWTLAYAVALVGPVCLLVLRAFDRSSPLILPDTLWCVAAVGGAATLLGSAVASPYSSTALLWAGPWLAGIAGFFVLFDAVQVTPSSPQQRRIVVIRMVVWFFLAVALASIVEWSAASWNVRDFDHLFNSRNPFPLGHSNYTAGLAILMLPLFAGAYHSRFVPRAVAAFGIMLALAMLFTSGSRAGVIALAVLATLSLAAARLRAVLKVRIGLAVIAASALFAIAHPRTRAMFVADDPGAPPNVSNVQRTAMLLAGKRMGVERPLLGWGPGTTPLAYPRYRAELPGGAENVLQLHSLPLQLWAELGLAGLACASLASLLVLRDRRREPLAAMALGGYAVFSIFDAQLDVPAFGFSVAALAALVAAPRKTDARQRGALLVGVFAIVALAVVTLAGRRDPTPLLNSEALRDDVGRAQPQRSRALLEQSLALNPDQEIAHLNLGWLLVVDEPAVAARHFAAAARLVPDKRGVYFGLGLAFLNTGDKARAVRGLALEMINDPVFQLSPWWGNPHLDALRPATLAEVERLENLLTGRLGAGSWVGGELRYLQALRNWIAGKSDGRAVAEAANSDARRRYFLDEPSRAALANANIRTIRHQRVGYPVLMRNLDILPPYDMWLIPERALRGSRLGHLLPEKGWLPSPELIALLAEEDLVQN